MMIRLCCASDLRLLYTCMLVASVADPGSWWAPSSLSVGLASPAGKVPAAKKELNMLSPDVFSEDKMVKIRWLPGAAPEPSGEITALLEPLARLRGGLGEGRAGKRRRV